LTRKLLSLAALLAAAPVFAGDIDADRLANWHHWRGPNADGSAPAADPPVQWDCATGKNVKWKAPLPGKGSASPVVWGDRVFVLTAVETDRVAKPEEMPKPEPKFEVKTDPPRNFYKFVVLCFDRGTGKLRWEKVAAERVPHEGHHVTHSYAGGSPTTDGRHLYVSFGSFGNYCFDLDGNLKWSRDLGRIHSRLGWGEAVTPVLHGDNLLLNWDQEADSALYCLDARTGETRWRAPRDERTTWNTPLVVEHNGRTQVIVNGTNRIRSHDLKTGEVIWSCGGMTVNPIPSPVRFGDAVVVMSGYNGRAAVAVPLDAAGDLGTGGKVLWRYGKGTPYVASPALAGDRLYFTDERQGILTVLDAKTGKPVIDAERLPGAAQFYASPVFAGGRVYLVDRNGTGLVLKPGNELEVLATNKLGDPVDASPAAVGKQLFLRGEKFLWCISSEK
jgi:outer membrane protein assembly factor BamB